MNGVTVVLESSSPQDSRQIAQGIFKQSRRNPSYQNRFRFYLDLWYLSSLWGHDSNCSHQGARLEPSAKSVETASPQLLRHAPDITASFVLTEPEVCNGVNRRQARFIRSRRPGLIHTLSELLLEG